MLENRRLFFEIWFFPRFGTFQILDSFGRSVKERYNDTKGYRSLNDAVDDFMYIIDQEEPDVEHSSANLSHLSRQLMRGSIGQRFNESIQVERLLEKTKATRAALHQMINRDIEEYQKTRVWKYKKNLLVRLFLGRRVLPIDFKDGLIMRSIKKVLNKDRDAKFITGYSLKGSIDIEIWYIKHGTFGSSKVQGGFYVFDLTSGQVVAKALASLRWAVFEVAKKLGTLDARSMQSVPDDDQEDDME